VSRLAVHLIVLIFAAASHATLLCNLWCGPHEPATHTCGHGGPAPRLIVTRYDTCDNATKTLPSVVREEVRRSGPAWETTHAVAASRYTIAAITLDRRIVAVSRGRLWLADQPLETNLRI
jgi:hypothetical protein